MDKIETIHTFKTKKDLLEFLEGVASEHDKGVTWQISRSLLSGRWLLESFQVEEVKQ